MQRLVTE